MTGTCMWGRQVSSICTTNLICSRLYWSAQVLDIVKPSDAVITPKEWTDEAFARPTSVIARLAQNILGTPELINETLKVARLFKSSHVRLRCALSMSCEGRCFSYLPTIFCMAVS
jgi:hypothetical protein